MILTKWENSNMNLTQHLTKQLGLKSHNLSTEYTKMHNTHEITKSKDTCDKSKPKTRIRCTTTK